MVMQAFLAALSDLALYRLAVRFSCASGTISSALIARWALMCLCTSWFHTFCAPRTLLNSLESQLAVLALLYYPAWAHSSTCSCGPPHMSIVAAREPETGAEASQGTGPGPEHSSRPVSPDLRNERAQSDSRTHSVSISACISFLSHLVRRVVHIMASDSAYPQASPSDSHYNSNSNSNANFNSNEATSGAASASASGYLRPHAFFTLSVALLLLLRPTAVTFLAVLGAHHLYVTRVRHWARLALDYAAVGLPVFALSLLADLSFYGRLTLPCALRCTALCTAPSPLLSCLFSLFLLSFFSRRAENLAVQ